MWGAIVKALLYIINPLNWPAIGAVLSSLYLFFKKISEYFTKKNQDKEMKDLNDALKDVGNAPNIDEKAKAGCRAEKVFDPNSDCDSGNGD